MNLQRENQPEFVSSSQGDIPSEHLKQVDQLFDQVFTDAPSFKAITVGPNHVFRCANSNYYDTLQLSPEIIGKEVVQVFPEIEAQGFIAHLDHVFRTGATFTVKLPLNRT